MDEKELQFQKSWYLDSIRDELIPVVGDDSSDNVAEAIYRRFARNVGDNDKGVLNDEEFVEFLELISHAVTLLPGTEQIESARAPGYFKRFLLRLRKYAGADDEVADIAPSLEAINIRSIMLVEGRLLIEGFSDYERIGEIERLLPSAEVAEDEAQDMGITICAGDTVVPLPDAGHYAERRYFGRTLVTYPTFEADFEAGELSEDDEIYFIAPGGASDGERRRIVFAEPEAGVSPGLGCLYKRFGGFALEYDPALNAIIVRIPSVSLRIRNESRAFRCLARYKMPLSKKLSALFLRIAYFATRPLLKGQRIRLYYDRIYMGDDNGQHLFEYSSDRCRAEGGPVGRHRYLASRYSNAYRELKRGGYKVHAYESFYRKLLALNAYIILATFANVKGFVGLDNFERRWLADLFSAHVICIQHDLTMQRVPQYRARYVDNAEMYFCASEKEGENLRRAIYGYKPSMIKVTGFARFDGLVSYPEGIILLAPTWRRSAVVEGDRPWAAAEYNPEFRNTAYFDTYKRLLTDEGLRSLLEESGYLLVFLLHPTLSSQASDFEEYAGGPIEVASSVRRGYTQYLNQAAVLITDYGGAQYDFAYMEKPVIYYHPDSLPPSYDSGDFDYATMGFGPIAKDMPELNKFLSELIAPIGEPAGDEPGESGESSAPSGPDESGEPDESSELRESNGPDESAGSLEMYADRESEFFAYHDRENRGRIYDEIEQEFGE
ncbi:MAG: CDP-glycerol glycerophosphotransferase family protein [Clostridiales Family XIII bacterium]|jgi:CDP-glycerol glycerophosphotransferase (TagB/SpsB family)|nr:CDP-glycerol glycerophosphotransferase family protein [Clostridiales Family XIII bacterium]